MGSVPSLPLGSSAPLLDLMTPSLLPLPQVSLQLLEGKKHTCFSPFHTPHPCHPPHRPCTWSSPFHPPPPHPPHKAGHKVIKKCWLALREGSRSPGIDHLPCGNPPSPCYVSPWPHSVFTKTLALLQCWPGSRREAGLWGPVHPTVRPSS